MPTHEQFMKESSASCPVDVADRQINPDQMSGNIEKWLAMDTDELAERRLAIVQYLETLEKEGKVLVGGDGKSGKGRGIVMTGGNGDTMSRLLVTLRILRKEYKTKLPVEVFAFPGEIRDSAVLDELKELEATVHELPGRTKLNLWKNFQIKAESIVASSFEEVLYLDSDNVPLRDPEHLFDAPLYAGKGQPGAVFWPDINKDHPENPVWRLMGKKCDYSQWELESGQILINKSGNDGLNLAALHVAMHMQLEHPFYFSLSGGDKDTFRYGFWALQLPYSVSPRWLSELGFRSPFDNNRFCGVVMLQYDIVESPTSGEHPMPLFVHANLLKHLNRVPNFSPFSVIKRAADDVAPSRTLDAVRAWVYNDGAGMCTDMEVYTDERGGGTGQTLVEEDFESAYGGVFSGWYDNVYNKYGGRTNGW
ncbi:hypothetical protein DL93DRAFT_2087974 [Clavulina sp. PMI_390]|nr:hypothetical protein DL93DRAFT_2087974 [Clavulina sp. PMI_390]